MALSRLDATTSEADASGLAFQIRRFVHNPPSQSRSLGLRYATSADVIDEAHGMSDITPRSAPPSDSFPALDVSSYAHADLGHVGMERVYTLDIFYDTSEKEEVEENIESHDDDECEGRSTQLKDNTDDASDADVEMSGLELSDWDSIEEDDEDRWEEVEAGNTGSLDRGYGVLDVISVDDGIEGLHASSLSLEGNLQDAPIPRNILRRLRAIHRNLQNLSAEMELENPNLDIYMGDLGDYVDARGFEELLQQFMDSDTMRRGQPPAAKAAIDGLPIVLVQWVDVDNDSALCAICRYLIELNEPAKQLPCSHLYHGECILPWLCVKKFMSGVPTRVTHR